MKISKSKYRQNIEAARQEGKIEIVSRLLNQNSIIFDDATGYGNAYKIPVTKGCLDSIGRAVAEIESCSDTGGE